MSAGHEVLIIEDDPLIARGLAQLVRAMGHVPFLVDNARDAATAVAERDFCYLLVDVGLPSEPGVMAMPITGLTLIKDVLRVRFGRRHPTTHIYVVPIIVISAQYEPKFVSLTLEIGGDAFIDKPSFEDFSFLTNKIQERLRLAEREDHAKCARLSQAPPAGSLKKVCAVVIDGKKEGSKTVVTIAGQRRGLTAGLFLPFLRLSALNMRNAESWGSHQALGMPQSRAGTSRLREVFEGLVPEAFEVLESDRSGHYRFNPAIAVERIDWEGLAGHSDAPVRKLASEHLGREKKK